MEGVNPHSIVHCLATFMIANLDCPDQVNVMDTLSRLSHDTDSEVAMVRYWSCFSVSCFNVIVNL